MTWSSIHVKCNMENLKRKLMVFLFRAGFSCFTVIGNKDHSLNEGKARWGCTWSTIFSSGPPSTRETGTYWKESSAGPPRRWRVWSTSPVRESWESWDGSAWRRLMLINVYKYLEGEYKEDRARLCLVVPSNGTRGNGHNQAHRRLPLSTRQHFCLHRLPREVVGSPP